jgi:hypothetical protein
MAVTLHAEIRDILIENSNRWMTTRELADEVNARGRYRKRDGSPVTDYQIHGRTRQYPDLFEKRRFTSTNEASELNQR